MIHRLLPLAALLAGGAAEVRFAPRVDTPYRLTRVEERDDGSGVRRFAIARTVIFRRDAAGYVARLSLAEANDSKADSAYAALSRSLAGEPVEVELDRGGRLLRVRALDAVWARLRDGIAAAAPDDRTRLALWRGHDAATTTQRVQVVAGALLAVLGAADAERRAGTRAVTLPAEGVGARTVAMTGSETVSVSGARVTIAIAARGTAGPDAVSLTRRREVDRRTGLATAQQEERRSAVTVDGRERAATSHIAWTLQPMVSEYPSANPPKS